MFGKGYMDRKLITASRIKDCDTKEYKFVEELLTTSFPLDEYRPLDEQRINVENVESFHMNILSVEEEPVGLLSYWQFDGYIYVEHFAISPVLRGKGYGCEAITGLVRDKQNVILEVELPTDGLARRRIAFYARCGFALCTKEYVQPAYRQGGNEVPMRIMYCGVDAERDFENIISTIYRTVYGKS